MNEKILIIGSTVLDIHLHIDHIPAPEEDMNISSQKLSVGGCAYNAASAVRLFNVPYTLFSPIGTGVFGSLVRSFCEESGVRPVLKGNGEHGCCYCLIDREGNRTFMAMHGSEYLFEEEMFASLQMAEYDMIYVCGLEIEEKTGDRLIRFLKEQTGKKIVYAPGARMLHIDQERNKQMFRLAGLVHMNRKEAGQFLKTICGESDDDICLLRKYTDADVIVTDGSGPIQVLEKDRIYEIPVEPVKQVNATGAGDSHIGAVMALLKLGCTLKEAVTKASLVSAAVVMSDSSVLTQEEFDRIII